MINYRFIIGSDTCMGTPNNNCAMIGFTVQANTQPEAIKKAQIVVDGLQLASLQLASDETDFGDKTFTSNDGTEEAEALEINIYAGDRLIVTADHIEDEWDEDEGDLR